MKTINVEKLLRDFHIAQGEKRGDWNHIKCPFCDDRSEHLGISNTTGYCWRCGRHSLIDIVQKMFGVSKKDAISVVDKYTIGSYKPDVSNMIKKNKKIKTKLPNVSDRLSPHHKNYLKRRKFKPGKIVKEYNIWSTDHIGRYKWRLIIPVYRKQELVTWTSRTILSSQKEPRYLSCPLDKSKINIKHCLYNIDRVQDKIIIVEGPTDVWRIGAGAAALFGKEISREQLLLLLDSQVQKAYIMLDNDAFENAEKIARRIASLDIKTEICILDKGKDPADYSQKEINKFRKEIKL